MRIPFLAVRAISDAATDTLDPALLALVDTDGKPRMTRVLLHLAGHPTKLRQLLRIRQASNLALSHMTATLQALVADGWPKSI